jgi:hypothetical protein
MNKKIKEPNPNQEALNLKKEINRLEMRKIRYCAPINAKIRDLQEKFESSCIHNETERKDTYEGGSYYDQCKYITKFVCKVCDKVLKEDVTYGGFN